MSDSYTATGLYNAPPHHTDCGIHPWQGKHNCGRTIPHSQPIPIRMAHFPDNFQIHSSSHPIEPQHRSICLSAKQPTAEVCKLAPRPRSLGSQCLCVEMAESESNTLHVPTTNPHRPDLIQAEQGESSNSNSDISVLAQ
ncbi:hypothetical protein LOD99_13829 [Oopsacas minuta]|uniref:Uncharacterized protein n=1 Tax=Oopsacas minuta TaxID=111878 RepID=A0AAV7KI98_9METZ|nr:hypothetical protein LOD99_13829 [Oopsacas minuta]